MSFIEVNAIKRDVSRRHELFSTFVSVRSLEDRWQHFPPCVLVKETVPNLRNIKNFVVHADDVFLCGFPRSGASIMQEIIWLIVNDFDFETARNVVADERFPMLESLKDKQIFHDGKVIIYGDKLPRPRTIKTHLPVQFLPDDVHKVKPKIVYLKRNVADVAISAYHFIVDDLHSYSKLSEFLQDFLDDKIVYTPYWKHLANFARMPDSDSRLDVEYEWMVENFEEAVERVAMFLGKEVSSDNLERLRLFCGSAKLNRLPKLQIPEEFIEKFEDFKKKAENMNSSNKSI